MDSDDVGVVEGGHDLDLSPDMDKVLLILDFVFPDGLYSHLQMSTCTEGHPLSGPGALQFPKAYCRARNPHPCLEKKLTNKSPMA